MITQSTHILAEFRGCDPGKLNDLTFIEECMRRAAKAANASVVEASFHKFGEQGVSGVLVLAESHLSMHTWPEHGYAATDIYVCGPSAMPAKAQESLRVSLCAGQMETMTISRGMADGMQLVAHTKELPQLGDESTDSGQRVDRS